MMTQFRTFRFGFEKQHDFIHYQNYEAAFNSHGAVKRLHINCSILQRVGAYEVVRHAGCNGTPKSLQYIQKKRMNLNILNVNAGSELNQDLEAHA